MALPRAGIRADRRQERFETKYGRYKPEDAPELQISRESQGVPHYDKAAKTLESYQVRDPGDKTGYQDAAAHAQGMRAALGIKGPVDTRDQIRTAATGTMDANAHQAAVADASNMRASGLSDSGTAMALASRRGTNLAGQKAGLEANLQQDYANRVDGYNQALLGEATNFANSNDQYNLARSGMLNAADANRAGSLASTLMATGSNVDNSGFQRDMALYDANEMTNYNQENAWKLAGMNDAMQRRAGLANFAGKFGGHLIQGAGIFGQGMMGGGGGMGGMMGGG